MDKRFSSQQSSQVVLEYVIKSGNKQPVLKSAPHNTLNDKYALKLAKRREKNRQASKRSRKRREEFMEYAIEYSKARKDDAEKLLQINVNFSRKIKKLRKILLAAGHNDIVNNELFDTQANKLVIKNSKKLLKNFVELELPKLPVGRRAKQDISPLSNDPTSSENPIMLDSEVFMSFEHNNQNYVNIHHSPAYLNDSRMNTSFEKSTPQIRSVSSNSESAYYQESFPQSYYSPSITEISEENEIYEIIDKSVESLSFQANINEQPIVNYIASKEDPQNRYWNQSSSEFNFQNQQLRSVPYMCEWNHNQTDMNQLSNGWNGSQCNNNFYYSCTSNEACNQPTNSAQNFYNTYEYSYA